MPHSLSSSLGRAGVLPVVLALVPCAGCRERSQTQQTDGPWPSQPSKPNEAPEAAPSPSASIRAQGLLEPSQSPSFGEPAKVEVQPPVSIPKPGKDSMDHAFVGGWSKDGREFGYCMTDGGLGATRCEFVTPDGKREELNDRDDKQSEGIDPAKTKAIRARIQERGYAVTTPKWPFGRDLVVAWTLQKPQSPEDPAKTPFIEVGAQLRGAAKPTVSLVLKTPSWHEIHPEVMALSPDGKWLGVVTHAFKGEFTDRFEVKVVPSARLAGEAYNDAGLALHRERRFAEAAPLFHKAAYANSASKVAMYNLACALAQFGDPGARTALKLAIEQDGEATKQKARTDADFASVRNEAWFTELTAPAR